MNSSTKENVLTNKNNTKAYNNFNIIRFFAAIMVIVGHMYPIMGIGALTVCGQAISSIGVKIFFLISGYLITESYVRDSNLIRYFIRRFFRIIPGLAFLILLTVFVFGPILTTINLSEYFSSPVTYNYLKNIFLYIQYVLPGVFLNNIYPNALNGSLWSLPAEVMMYALLPIVLGISKSVKKGFVVICPIILILVTSNIIVHLYNPAMHYIVYGTNIFDVLNLAPYFFIGSLFTLPNMKKLLNLQLAAGMMFVFMMCNFTYAVNELFMCIVLPHFVFSFSIVPNAFFGKYFSENDYSYGIYLYGFLIQQTSINFLSQYNLTYNQYLIVSIIFSFIFAFISWHLIEKPAQKLGKFILNLEYVKNM